MMCVQRLPQHELFCSNIRPVRAKAQLSPVHQSGQLFYSQIKCDYGSSE